MNKRVEEFLENNKQATDRAKILIEAGLYDKIYADSAGDTLCSPPPDYPESEYDSTINKTVYYRKEPINVTDEEFEAIRKCVYLNKNNALASTIKVISYIIFICGFFAGCFAGGTLSAAIVPIVWLLTAIAGISILWFGEVLSLLQDIKNGIQQRE